MQTLLYTCILDGVNGVPKGRWLSTSIASDSSGRSCSRASNSAVRMNSTSTRTSRSRPANSIQRTFVRFHKCLYH